MVVNPPTPCRIGKRPPAPENQPAIGGLRGGGCNLDDDDGDLHNKNPPTPCLWQAPASGQKIKRKTRPAIRRSERFRAMESTISRLLSFLSFLRGRWRALAKGTAWAHPRSRSGFSAITLHFACGSFVLTKPRGSLQSRVGIAPPARLDGVMWRCDVNPHPGSLPLGQ